MSTNPADSRPIVVGVDDSAGARAALRFALEEGLARGTTVEVVTTWVPEGSIRQPVTDQLLADEAHAARELQDQVLAEAAVGLPRMPPITQLVLHDAGGGPLVEVAKDAALLVVGSGRKGRLARSFLGSVSEYCVRHARVPVVVVPDPSRLPQHDYADWLAATPSG
jgi:nucleotide-binding universal stress UspA family protein